MKEIAKTYKTHLSDREFIRTAAFSILLLLGSLCINFFAGTYAAESVSNPVTDLILSNVRVYDLDGLFIYGAVGLVVWIAILCLLRPQRIPFTLKCISLFILIRSVFVSLTHIGPFPGRVIIDPASFISDFSFGGDLFFSGHTGLPFLMALIYWDDIRLRVAFIATSVAFGVIVLLAHLHYSIDVLSAFFITYTIYRMAESLFKNDLLIFKGKLGRDM